jgi:hypothetical protein
LAYDGKNRLAQIIIKTITDATWQGVKRIYVRSFRGASSVLFIDLVFSVWLAKSRDPVCGTLEALFLDVCFSHVDRHGWLVTMRQLHEPHVATSDQ